MFATLSSELFTGAARRINTSLLANTLIRYYTVCCYPLTSLEVALGSASHCSCVSINQLKVLTKPHSLPHTGTEKPHPSTTTDRGQQTLRHEVPQAWGAKNESRQHIAYDIACVTHSCSRPFYSGVQRKLLCLVAKAKRESLLYFLYSVCVSRVSSFSLYQILYRFKALLWESIIFLPPPPFCKAYPIAILFHDHCAIYALLPTPLL